MGADYGDSKGKTTLVLVRDRDLFVPGSALVDRTESYNI